MQPKEFGGGGPGLVEVEQDVKVPLLVLDIAVELADPPSWMSTLSFGTPCPW